MLIANDENGSGGSAVVMRCAAAKDDVRKLEVYCLSVPVGQLGLLRHMGQK